MKAIAELIEWAGKTLWDLCVILWNEFGLLLIIPIVLAIILYPLATSEGKMPWESGYFTSKMKDDIDEINRKLK